MKVEFEVRTKSARGRGDNDSETKMTPMFLMLENGRIVVPLTEMSKTGCGKAGPSRWDMQAKQESLLGHPKRCQGGSQM